jgi:hypothetical protein
MTPRRRLHQAWGSASLVFGVILIWLGHEHQWFEGEGRWFGTGVAVVIWVTVVALLGRYFRDNPPPEG